MRQFFMIMALIVFGQVFPDYIPPWYIAVAIMVAYFEGIIQDIKELVKK